jgi:hypothetical protein
MAFSFMLLTARLMDVPKTIFCTRKGKWLLPSDDAVENVHVYRCYSCLPNRDSAAWRVNL